MSDATLLADAPPAALVEAPPEPHVESPSLDAPEPKTPRKPQTTYQHHAEWIRFDAASDAFEEIATIYRRAVDSAERLWNRIERAEEDGDPSLVKKLTRRLAALDERLDVARARIDEHTTATMKKPMRERARPARVQTGSGKVEPSVHEATSGAS